MYQMSVCNARETSYSDEPSRCAAVGCPIWAWTQPLSTQAHSSRRLPFLDYTVNSVNEYCFNYLTTRPITIKRFLFLASCLPYDDDNKSDFFSGSAFHNCQIVSSPSSFFQCTAEKGASQPLLMQVKIKIMAKQCSLHKFVTKQML